jgi:putative endonuclease
MPFVYMVACADGSFYTGWTTDLEARVAAHNVGQGSAYTRSRRPVRLVYWEEQPTRSKAMQREAAIKKMTRARKKRLIRARATPPPARNHA